MSTARTCATSWVRKSCVPPMLADWESKRRYDEIQRRTIARNLLSGHVSVRGHLG